MEVMILDNASNNDLVTTGHVKTLKRTLSAPGEDVCRKRCRCENCKEEFFHQRAERKAEIAVRKAERLAVCVERLAAKIERQAAKAERMAAKAERKSISKRKVSKTRKENRAVEQNGDGQTHALSKQFQQLASLAYSPDVGEKILAKGFSKIVLDGNNMLFVTDALRKNTISGKRKQSEKLLSVAALAFSQLVGVTTEVIFDQTNLPRRATHQDQSHPALTKSTFKAEIVKISENFPVVGVPVVFSNGISVLVSSAKPEFATTDDKLVSWARDNGQTPSGLTNSDVVVVSSDRALSGELYSLGVSLIKPGQWIILFASLVEEQAIPKEMAFKWFDQYCLSLVAPQ